MIGMLACAFIFIWAIYQMFLKKSPIAHIPGPRALPLIGNIHQMDADKPFLGIHAMSKTYGGIYSFQLFTEPVVIVTGSEHIHTILVEKSAAFAGRPNTFRLNINSNNQSGIIWTNVGPEHKARRKLAHGFIKQFGAGMENIEQVTTRLLKNMVTELTALKGEALDWSDLLRDLNLNIIVVFLTGESVTDKKHMKLIHSATYDLMAGLDLEPFGALLDKFPFMKIIPNKTFRNLVKAVDVLCSQVKIWMDSSSTKGFIKHVEELSIEDQQKYGVSSVIERITVSYDLLQAAILTTSATMYSLMNVLSQMPRVQDKLRAEVIAVVGTSRLPTLADRERMPYHRAAILEIGRFASIAPFAGYRAATEDTSLGGFFIPKDMQVIFSLWSMHHDEDFWGDPHTFRPERYLDTTGSLVPANHPNRRYNMPFGAGVRVCVGEQFALTRMFLILSTLVQQFVIEPETTVDAQPSMDPRDMRWGLVLLPPPYKLRFIPINASKE